MNAKPGDLFVRLAFLSLVLAALAGLFMIAAGTGPFRALNAWYYAVPQTHYVERIQIAEFRSEIKVTSFAAHMIILCAQIAIFGVLAGWLVCLYRPLRQGRWSLAEKSAALLLCTLTGSTILAYSLSCFISLPGTADICSLYAKEGVIDAGHFAGFVVMAGILWTAAWRFGQRRRRAPALGLVTVAVALGGAVAFAIGMEEVSWGQTYLGWQSPEFFQTYNDQQETNAHNFFNAYLTPIYYAIGAAIMVATIAWPVLAGRFGDRLAWLRTLSPPRALIWVAVWFPLAGEIFIFSSTETFETVLMIYGLAYATALLARSAQGYSRAGEAAAAGRMAAGPAPG